MKPRWLALFAAMCCVLLLLPGCTTRISGTTPAAPTTIVVPTQEQVPQPSVPPVTAGPTPDFTARPGPLTVKGKLESGADWGTTGDGHYFMGSPDAPIMFTEFSDYQ